VAEFSFASKRKLRRVLPRLHKSDTPPRASQLATFG